MSVKFKDILNKSLETKDLETFGRCLLYIIENDELVKHAPDNGIRDEIISKFYLNALKMFSDGKIKHDSGANRFIKQQLRWIAFRILKKHSDRSVLFDQNIYKIDGVLCDKFELENAIHE